MLVRVNEIEIVYKEVRTLELSAISEPKHIIQYFAGAFDNHLEQEQIWVVFLNGGNFPIGRKLLTIGLNNQTQISPMLVFRFALIAGASSIIIAHNHPSGAIMPSMEDLSITRALCKAGHLLKCPVLDHLIFTQDYRYTSIKSYSPMLFTEVIE